MPIYEYMCTKCSKKFEVIKSINNINEETFCDCSDNAPAKRIEITERSGNFKLLGFGWSNTLHSPYLQANKHLLQKGDEKLF